MVEWTASPFYAPADDQLRLRLGSASYDDKPADMVEWTGARGAVRFWLNDGRLFAIWILHATDAIPAAALKNGFDEEISAELDEQGALSIGLFAGALQVARSATSIALPRFQVEILRASSGRIVGFRFPDAKANLADGHLI